MSQYIPAAEVYYETRVLSREVRDPVAEEVYLKERGVPKQLFRRVLASESNGQLYKYFDRFFALSRYSAFGLGIGVYFFQLLAFAAVSLVGGLILIPVLQSFDRSDYGVSSAEDVRLSGTAACNEAINTTAMCSALDGSNSTCTVMYRENCEYPGSLVYISDLGMVVAVAALLIVSRFVQNFVQERLDDKVQSTQDYSLMVTNPPPDASDPEEWGAFFARFGKVRYITVVKMNASLLDLLLRKMMLLRKLEHIGISGDSLTSFNPIMVGFWKRFTWSLGFEARSKERLLHKLHELNQSIDLASKIDYPVGCVYVTFELEDAKQFCMHALRNEKALCASISNVYQQRLRFRGHLSLTVLESSEPDNVAWQNSGIRRLNRFRRFARSFCLCAGTMYLSYLAVNSARDDPLLMLVYITIIDNCLPIIFTYITSIEGFVDEDDRQNSLMVKLFAARLLSSTVFPFITTEWYSFLSSETIIRIKNVVLSCCFVSPTVALLDLNGIFRRQILTRLFAHSQEDANKYWSGDPFTIANRYTEVSKIVFIVLFHSLVDPGSLFIAAFALVYIYAVDRYMLFRRSGRAPLLDNSMGPMVLKQVGLALVAKLVVSLYYTYSWPMDNAYKSESGELVMVDKIAHVPFWRLERGPWHSNSQWEAVVYYRKFLYAIGAVVVISWAFDVATSITDIIFTKTSYDFAPTQASKFTPFSALSSVTAYVPIVRSGPESFVAADTRFMQSRHRPDTVDLYSTGDTQLNLASLLPHYALEKCMSSVRWFEDDATPQHTKVRRKTTVLTSADVELGAMFDGPTLKAAELYDKPSATAPPKDTLNAPSQGGMLVAKRRFQSGSSRALIFSRLGKTTGTGTILPVHALPQADGNALQRSRSLDQSVSVTDLRSINEFKSPSSASPPPTSKSLQISGSYGGDGPTETSSSLSPVRELISSAQRKNIEKVPFSNEEKEVLKKMKKDLISESIKGKRHVKLLLGRRKFADFDEFYSVIKDRCPSLFTSETSYEAIANSPIDSESGESGSARIRGRGAKRGVLSESGIRMQLRVIFVKILSRQRERRLANAGASAATLHSSTSYAMVGPQEDIKDPSSGSRNVLDCVDMEAFFQFVNSFAAAS